LIFPIFPTYAESNSQYSENIEKALKWLKEGYNATLGLIRENHLGSSNPDRENNYWLFSDNFLVYLVLIKYDRELAYSVLDKIHSYGYYQNYKHSAYLMNYKIRMPPYGALQTSGLDPCWFLVKNDSTSEIWLESYINATVEISDYEDCVSWLFPKALTYYWEGETEKAREVYQKALNDYWDGNGFLPLEYDCYVTYKVGASLYTGLVLYPYDWQIPVGLSSKFAYWKALLWKLQRENGGIPTHYKEDLTSEEHDANTETACFTLLYTTIRTVETKKPMLIYGELTVLGVCLAFVIKSWKRIFKT